MSTSTVTVTTVPPDYYQVNGITLNSGSETTKTTQGTANLQFLITGPLATATTALGAIIAINISNGSSSSYPTVFQCTTSTLCTAISEVPVKEYGVTNFNSAATAFYIGTGIESGQPYDYAIIFSNENSAAGTVMAS